MSIGFPRAMQNHAEEFLSYRRSLSRNDSGMACDNIRDIVSCDERVAGGSIALYNVDARMMCSMSLELSQ